MIVSDRHRDGGEMTVPRVYRPEFGAAVRRLQVPAAGTEVVAYVLAGWIHLVRPRRVLEVGMGFTTPFLAAALADVEEAVRAESQGLTEKARPYLASGAVLDDEWLTTAPPLVTPTFYLEPYAPRLVAVDNLSDADSSARSVQEVLQVLDLDASLP